MVDDYINQLEQTVETLKGKLEDTSKKLEVALETKAGKLIPSWREDSIYLPKRGKDERKKNKDKVYIYGCVGIFDFIWLSKYRGKDNWWRFGYFYDGRVGSICGMDVEYCKKCIESMYMESVDWYGVDVNSDEANKIIKRWDFL